MSSGPAATWLSVLEDKQEQLSSLAEENYPIPKGPLERKALRDKLEPLCRKQKTNPLAAGNKYYEAERYIIQLAQGVTGSAPSLQDRPDGEGLDSVINRVALAIFENGYQHGTSLSGLISLLAQLNRTVPSLGSDVTRFPEDEQIQRPLQEIYSILLASFVEVLKTLSSSGIEKDQDLLEDEASKKLVVRTRTSIDEAKHTFGELIRQTASRIAIQDDRERVSRKSRRRGKTPGPEDEEVSFKVGYKFVGKRGEGSYGTVEEVEEQSTGNRYIRKRILMERGQRGPPRKEMEKKVEEEVNIMRNLRHQNIVTLTAFFKEQDTWSIILHPVAKHDLKQFFCECAKANYHEDWTGQISPWFEDLLDALAFTHKKSIRHRDIKPSNILINEKAVYLCDFGLARDFSGHESSASHGPMPEGTLDYRAPEVRSDQRRGRLADVFSLGCVFSELIGVKYGRSTTEYWETRRHRPFRDSLPEVQEWVKEVRDRENSRILCRIIIRMLDEDPIQRMEAQTALDLIRRDRRTYESLGIHGLDLSG